MTNRDQDNLYLLHSIMDYKNNADNILSFGYYLSSKQDHLYSFDFYIDEFKNYKEFAETFRKRYKLCNDTIELAKKKYSNLWSYKGFYGLGNTKVNIEIICDGLFMYSYPRISTENDDVNMDKELVNSFTANMINREFVNVKLIAKNKNADCIDIHKKINISKKPEQEILYAVIKMIKTACRVHLNRESYEHKK